MKKKIIISALALTIGAGLAGSITGTVAWYQYSTRTNAAYVGAAGGTSGNLQMRIRKDGYNWTTRYTYGQIETYLASTTEKYGNKVLPITSGALAKDAAVPTDFYANPLPGKGPYEKWQKASKQNYVVIPLQFRYVERDGDKEGGAKDDKNIAKDVYLSELRLEQRNNDTHEDISDALRFHVSSYSTAAPTTKINRLVSKKGGTTVTNGKLDLDGDGKNDQAYAGDKYGFDDSALADVVYGSGVQESFTNLTSDQTGVKYYDANNAEATDANVYSLVAEAEGEDTLNLVDDSLVYNTDKSKSIGSTVESETEYLNVDLTIWVEGWQKFALEDDATKFSSLWSGKYIGAEFQIGFEFAVDSEVDA